MRGEFIPANFTNVKSKQFFSIHQWTAAFDIFMSLFIVKSPESSLGLIKYAYNVRAKSKQFGFPIAKSYDENVRKVCKMMMFDWAIINEELWQCQCFPQSRCYPSKNKQTKFNLSLSKAGPAIPKSIPFRILLGLLQNGGLQKSLRL